MGATRWHRSLVGGLVGRGGTKSRLTARMAAGWWAMLDGIQPTNAARPANGPSAASVGAKLDSGKCYGTPASSDHNVARWNARGWGIPCGACRSDAHIVHSGTAGEMANGKPRNSDHWRRAAKPKSVKNGHWRTVASPRTAPERTEGLVLRAAKLVPGHGGNNGNAYQTAHRGKGPGGGNT